MGDSAGDMAVSAAPADSAAAFSQAMTSEPSVMASSAPTASTTAAEPSQQPADVPPAAEKIAIDENGALQTKS